MNNQNITVRKKDIIMRKCEDCGTVTAHVGKTNGTVSSDIFGFGSSAMAFSTCIQCFVDMNNVLEWSRWLDKDGKPVVSAISNASKVGGICEKRTQPC